MRILMLDNELPPLGGGMGTAHLALMNYFKPFSDVEIDVVTSALGWRSEFERFSERIRIYKVPVVNNNIHHSSNRELISYAAQSLFVSGRLIRARPYDFCFAWSALPAGGVALMLRGIFRLPYMVWVSGPDIPGFEQRYTRIYRMLLPLIRTIWRQARPLIAKCKEEMDMIRAVAPNQPVTIIPNGVDLTGFRPDAAQNRRGPLKVICVARLIERKGQPQLFQAIRSLADQGIQVHLRLVGAGDSLRAFQLLTKELGIAGNVEFAGYVPREEILQHYRAADVFVLPSFNEGMSLAALEAMGAGLPVVCTRAGGAADLVEEGVNGFTYDWGDIERLAACLGILAREPERIMQMGKESRRRAMVYDWSNIGAQYYALFNRALAEGNTP